MPKNQPSLPRRLENYKRSKTREWERHAGMNTPKGTGRANAIATVLQMLDVDLTKVESVYLSEVEAHLWYAHETHKCLILQHLDSRELRYYHKAAAEEYYRLRLEIQALGKPMPEDMI